VLTRDDLHVIEGGKQKKKGKVNPMDYYKPDDPQLYDCILTRILHIHAEETITDEQIQRVLAPVRERIKAGEFDLKPQPRLRLISNTPGR